MTLPDKDDVLVRQQVDGLSAVFLLGTPVTADQFMVRTRDEAVAQALAYARQHHVRAWFVKGDDDFVLLGMFRADHASDRIPQRLT